MVQGRGPELLPQGLVLLVSPSVLFRFGNKPLQFRLDHGLRGVERVVRKYLAYDLGLLHLFRRSLLGFTYLLFHVALQGRQVVKAEVLGELVVHVRQHGLLDLLYGDPEADLLARHIRRGKVFGKGDLKLLIVSFFHPLYLF